ncbi:hypothetical protein GCM10009799_41120 [Nocardiopsis rhodophaea]|uniref:Secreted protein n=2 Tax=Nocardiopsis rhodophaea TaxID=280238 RepID=A0ABP5F0Q9_9ACTN
MVGAVGASFALTLAMPTAVYADQESWKDWSPVDAPVELQPRDSDVSSGSVETVEPSLHGEETAGDAVFSAEEVPGARHNVVELAPGEAASPQVRRTEVEVSQDDWNDVWCRYNPSVHADPSPPAKGRQYAMARAASPSLYGWAQAFDAQNGFGQQPHTSTATLKYNLAISIGMDWPQPSHITGFANPSFKGGVYAESKTSPITFSQSKASGGKKIDIGIARSGTYEWKNLWDLKYQRQDGIGYTKYWNWTGLDDGTAYAATMDATPGHTYDFTVQTKTSATSEPVFGASAQAQTDFGSAGLDAPSLAPGLFFKANDQSNLLIRYRLPAGWTATC